MPSNVPSSSQDHTLAARVAARVIARAGDAVGAGFLVGPDLVATCAHVVATATGADPYGPEPPPDPVRLDFPMLGDAARAVVHRWLPIAEDGTGDVAVLKLIDPLPRAARMPPLRRIDQLWDQRFRVLGFPEGMADGVWTTGRIRGEQGTRWFQLQTTVGEQPIVEGFSGAPVWHEETGAVVGMTVAADRSGRTTTAYLIPVEQVLGADPELLPCPYRGLEAFGEEHAEFFFGRDADVAALADALAAHPLVAVVGPSGVGKSSLVGAGLVPRLRAEGTRVARLTPIPGQPVEPALTAALAPVPPGGGTGKRVLVVDQFEELAAAQPDAARLLLERVGELVTGTEPISAVLTLRSATLDEVVVPELAGLLGAGTVLVPPMQRGQLREAIVAPAERAPGLSFEAGLVDRILDDAAAEPGHLPLVESLLTELWSRRDGGYLTIRGYEEAGGVAGVIATHAEAVLAGFTDPEDPARLRRLLTALARPDRDGGFTRTSLPWADVAPDLRPVVHRLAAGRLVVVARSSTGTEHVQLAHQALIAHWPRLRDWLAEDRDFLAWRAQLDEQRERWEDADRDDGALLRGTPLSTALDWLPARSGDVSEASREYVRRSRARQRREVRRWRLVTAVLAVLVLAAATLSVVAVTRGNRINDQLRLANAELVAQTALRQAGVDPVAATRLALTAWHLDPGNAAARTALVTQYLAMRSVEATVPDVGGGGGALDSIAVPLGGADRILVRNGRSVTLIDNLAAGRPERWDLPAEGEYRTAGFVDGGRTLLVFAANGDILRWDLATRSGPDRTPTGIVPTGTSLVELDPAATKLAWTQEVGPGVHALELRDTRTGAVIPHRIDPIADPGGVTVELPADPGLVVLQGGTQAARPGPLVVRSLADGVQRAAFPPGSAMASPLDGHVLSCEQDGSVAVLRALADGAEIRRFALLGRCSSELPLRLTADGKHLVEVTVATGDADSRTARITRLDDGQTFGLALPPDTRYALDPARPIPMVVVGSDAAPAVLLAHGTSVLRLRARPVPTDPQVTLWPADDERYLVGTEASRTTVFDRELRPVAVLDNEQAGITTESFTYVTSGLIMLSRAPQGWAVIDLAVPSLDRRSTRPLAAVTARRPSLEVTKDRIVSKSENVVTTWDRATGAQLFEPTLLPEADHRSNGSLAIRPGRPDEVVLTKGIGAEIWDLRHRRRIAEIPLTDTMQPLTLAFFPSGDRVVGLTLGSNLEIRSLADLQPVRPAFPAPGAALLLGVTQDEYILTLRNEDERHVVFWDARRGIESGTFSLPTLYRLGDVTEDGRHLSINAVNGGVPFTMPVTAQQWAERLCAIADLPFTDQDRALLPVGIEADRPCGAG